MRAGFRSTKADGPAVGVITTGLRRARCRVTKRTNEIGAGVVPVWDSRPHSVIRAKASHAAGDNWRFRASDGAERVRLGWTEPSPSRYRTTA